MAAVRVVQDFVQSGRGARHIPLGTKVRDDVLTNDPDTLFPLQAALGYELTQSFFVGENTLLVEGPGDSLYIQALSDALRQMKRGGLDERWTLCPAGGELRPEQPASNLSALWLGALEGSMLVGRGLGGYQSPDAIAETLMASWKK